MTPGRSRMVGQFRRVFELVQKPRHARQVCDADPHHAVLSASIVARAAASRVAILTIIKIEREIRNDISSNGLTV
jgi:hypothetical protein